jgi:VRR-NUC domain
MARAAFKLRAPTPLEHPIQVQIAKVLTLELAPPGRPSEHGVVWYSIDHADYAGNVPGIRMARGIIAGIPDTFILYRGLCHLIEVKTDNGILSDAQRSVIAACITGHARVGVCGDAIEVLHCLDNWQIPRARRVRLDGQ